jgi:hypothetical protein
MNRVLRRPMFRTGGSAEGITSGLDNPQLTASRPAYNRGRVVNPGGYQGDDEIDRALKSMDDERVQKFIKGTQESRFPQFLTSMGLDLLTRPKAGNIFQQVAASAKGPYSEWMAAKAARGAGEDKLSAALFGDLLDIETKKTLQKEKLVSEEKQASIKATAEKEFDIGEAAKIARLRDDMYQKQLELNTEKSQIEAIPELERTDEQNQRLIQIVEAELPSTQGTIADLEGAESTIEKINAAGQIDAFNDLIGEYEGEGMTYEEAFLKAIKFYEGIFSKVGKREGGAEGGRIGYQNAGPVMPSAVPAAMQAPGPTDQGQDDTVQDLSFEELRARLPQEITNDIVKLLSESKQALVDFANIRTQLDVNEFNQKYDVNLVVPQEV